jgi:hypothetical protein
MIIEKSSYLKSRNMQLANLFHYEFATIITLTKTFSLSAPAPVALVLLYLMSQPEINVGLSGSCSPADAQFDHEKDARVV